MIQFSKLHGAGNDFIIIEDVGLELESYCELAKKYVTEGLVLEQMA